MNIKWDIFDDISIQFWKNQNYIDTQNYILAQHYLKWTGLENISSGVFDALEKNSIRDKIEVIVLGTTA